MQLQERYQRSFEYWQDKNDEGWQDWFNPDIPRDLAFPAETEFVDDVVSEMLESGETLWHHPGWIKDLWNLLIWWAEDEKFIRIRLYVEWLITTLPPEPIDLEFSNKLQKISQGMFDVLNEEEVEAIFPG